VPKLTNHPRLRTLVRKGANGQRWVYYYFDMRSEGKPDISLGKDHATALVKWDELFNKKPQAKGRIQEAINSWREEALPGYANAQTRAHYTRQLKRIEAWCGQMAWHEMTLPLMRQYLKERKGKTQANREMAVFSIVWNHARMKGMTELQWPAAGMKRSGWKNPERPRVRGVSDEVFDAIYAKGDQILRDAMDIVSSTAMRITDARTVPLPPADNKLRMQASKTGKRAEFDVALSPALAPLVARRRANKRAMHLKLLTTPTGREVSYAMLAKRFRAARDAAAKAAKGELADVIRSPILRDFRKYASDQPDTLAEAAELLQHDSSTLTARHYRTRAVQLKPAR
jgi:hypothetical protein